MDEKLSPYSAGAFLVEGVEEVEEVEVT